MHLTVGMLVKTTKLELLSYIIVIPSTSAVHMEWRWSTYCALYTLRAAGNHTLSTITVLTDLRGNYGLNHGLLVRP